MSLAADTAATFALTSPAQGVEQRAFFIRGPSGEIFCMLHSPLGGARSTLVMCPPFLADHPFSYRREVLLALELAQKGVAVWRFHYAGTGYSDGSPREQSLESMVADAAAVVDDAAPDAVGGTRGGAIVAAAIAGGRPLVLWEPVLDGSVYLREGFRARMIADGGQLNRRPPTTEELLTELRATGRVELVGYSLYEPLHDSLDHARIDLPRGPVLHIAHAGAHDVPTHDLTTATAGVAEGWWFHRTQQSDHARLAAELAEAIGPWLPRAKAAVDVEPPAHDGERECAFIGTGDATVFGLLTPPTAAPRDEAALLLWGGGGMPAFGRNQVATVLARKLAGRGYHVLQVDYPGRGDSPGAEPPDPIDEPAKQEVFAAVRDAYEWLRSRGLVRVLTIGSCQGAVAALNTADAATTLTGLVLLAPPIGERFEPNGVGGGACEMLTTIHPRMLESFDRFAQSGIPMLIAYGVHDEGFESFQAAMAGELGTMLRPARDRLTLTLTEERIHGFMTVAGQEATIDIVNEWLDRIGG